MSTQANTRIFKGSILAVDDLAASTIQTGLMISTTGFGAAASEIPASTAASTIDEFRLGLQDSGDASFEFFLDMDNEFQQEMEVMRDARQTREFTLTLPEGTINTLTFQAYVVDSAITGASNDLYKMSLVLGITSAVVRTAV